jgi:predicted TIM-barrel fold metal-dependent hydrolase
MRTITIEEHFLTEGFRKAMQRDFPNKVGRSNSTSIDVGDHAKKLVDLGSQRLQDMDAGGVDFQVISHTAFGTIPFESSAEEVRLVRDANDQLATAIATHPDRFGGFVTLPMIDPQEAITELERMIHVPGFKGIMINGLTQGRFLDHPLYFPILERAAALKVPILSIQRNHLRIYGRHTMRALTHRSVSRYQRQVGAGIPRSAFTHYGSF